MNAWKLAGVGAVAIAILLAVNSAFSHRRPKLAPPAADYATTPASKLPAFVEAHQADADPKMQDQVGEARIRIAYRAAAGGHWEQARAQLLTAEREYRGTGKVSAAFGGVPDEARYQADVCLAAEGKKPEAKVAFAAFLKDRPLSPLCTAAYRRLVRLNGNPKPEWEALLQKDLSAQQENFKLETSSCGPKSIARALRILKGSSPDYKLIAKICGTTERGTSVDEMCAGLRRLGSPGFAYELSRKDLQHAPLPAILLHEGHYTVLEKIALDQATLYDPLGDRERTQALPPLNSPDFSVTAIVFSPMELSQ